MKLNRVTITFKGKSINLMETVIQIIIIVLLLFLISNIFGQTN